MACHLFNEDCGDLGLQPCNVSPCRNLTSPCDRSDDPGARSGRSPATVSRAIHLPLGVALGDRLTLVVLLLSARQPDLYLQVVAPLLEVQLERHQRVALLLN